MPETLIEEMMKNDTAVFKNVSVPRAIAQNSIPAIVSMIVVLAYNIADTFFVGQTGSTLQVAAVALTTPVFLLFMATGNLFGIGGTSVISRAFGSGRKEYAMQTSAFCFYSAVLVGVLYVFVFWIFMPNILEIIGVSEDTVDYARSYLMVVAPSAPFVLISTAFSNIIRAEGKSFQAMMGMMIGTLVNIVLDPILILGMDLGVVGAALATVVGNVIGAGYYILHFLRKKFILSISPRDFRVGERIMTSVLEIGIPASLNNVLMSISFIILNNFLSSYGDIPVAAMGIAMRVGMIVVLLQIGLGIGIQPLLGYNFGARNEKRFKNVLKTSILYSLILGSVLTLICWIEAGAIIRAFIDDESVFGYGVSFVKAILLPGPVIGVLFIYTNTLQAMGAAKESLVLSISRQGLFFIPLLFLLNTMAGIDGIAYTQAISDLSSLLMSVFLYKFRFKRLWVKI